MDESRNLKAGRKLALSRALSAIESSFSTGGDWSELDKAVQKAVGRVIGLTGPPGVGKSTLVNSMIRIWRKQGKTVGVIAIDPSSKLSGGALLGDRTRLETDPDDEGVFIRSMAARDRLGGLSDVSIAATAILRSEMDRIIVETVGVGQSETDVSLVADSILLCIQPGSGDSLQFMKAGVMELPDVIAVTKGDLESLANRTCADVESALTLIGTGGGDWKVPVELVSAKSGRNIDSLLDRIESHLRHNEENGNLKRNRRKQHELWVRDYIRNRYGSAGVESIEYFGLDSNCGDSPFSQMREADRRLNAVKNSGSSATKDRRRDIQEE